MVYKRRITLWLLLLVLTGTITTVVPAKAAINVDGVRINIPTLKVDAAIVEAPLDGSGSSDVASLGNNVAHLEGTSWISDSNNKNVVLAGHRQTTQWQTVDFLPIKSDS